MIFVVDFDNTITKNTNGIDIRTTIPEVREEIIEHLKTLKEQGHYIKIVTARGCLSCNNDMQKRIAKYYDCVKGILKHYDIPYDELSFNKEYGEVYLDDSAANPIMSKFKIFTNPNSKNTVVRYGDMIVKTGPTVEDEYNWYQKNKVFNIPDCISYNPKQHVLYMKFIPSEEMNEYEYAMMIRKAFAVEKTNCSIEIVDNFFLDSMGRKKVRLNSEKIEKIHKFYESVWGTLKKYYSEESHGDLTMVNMMRSSEDGHIYVIDPVAPEGQYRSPLLDFGKFLFSMDQYLFPVKYLDESRLFRHINYQWSLKNIMAIKFCQLLCYLRISKYRDSEEDIEHIEDMVSKLIKEIESLKGEGNA